MCASGVATGVGSSFATLSKFASGISKARVGCPVSVRGNDYFSNGQEHWTLVWSIPDASGVVDFCAVKGNG